MTSDFRVKFGSLQFLHKVVVATPIDANDYSLFSAYNFSLEPWCFVKHDENCTTNETVIQIIISYVSYASKFVDETLFAWT